MRRRDRIRAFEAAHEAHDDRASAVTSNTEERVAAVTTTRTLHAQQVEVAELDKGGISDRIVECVSSSIVLRTFTRTGNPGAIVSCVLGGGAISFLFFRDTRFFALLDSDIPQIVCIPKRTSIRDFRALVESTLKVKCVEVPMMASALTLDAALMQKVWRVADAIPGAVGYEAARTEDARDKSDATRFDHLQSGAGAFFELSTAFDGHHRVSASQSHLNAAVDEFVRTLNETTDVRVVGNAMRAVTIAVREHATAGRLAGAVPYVHAIRHLMHALATPQGAATTALECCAAEVSQAIVHATAMLMTQHMEIVATNDATSSIIASLLALFDTGTNNKLSRSTAFAACAAAALLSVRSEDCIMLEVQANARDSGSAGGGGTGGVLAAKAGVFRGMIRCARTTVDLVLDTLRPRTMQAASDVAEALLSLVGGDPVSLDGSDGGGDVPAPAPGTVEAIWSGACFLLTSAQRFLDEAVVSDAVAADAIAPVFLPMPRLTTSLAFTLALLHASRADAAVVSLLQRWFTSFSTLFRRANMWCGLLGLRVATGAAADGHAHPVAAELVRAATALVLTKAYIAPSSGTQTSHLGFVAHQWLVKLGISAGAVSLNAIVCTLDEFARGVFHATSVARATQLLAWQEAETVFKGLADSVPSPSPMLRMWEHVIAVVRDFRDFVDTPDEAVARRLAGHVVTPSVVEQRCRDTASAISDAEQYLREAPWQGADEFFDVTRPVDLAVSLPAIVAMSDRTSDGPALPTFARFGVTPVDLEVVGPALVYLWPSLVADTMDNRTRSLAGQCLRISTEFRRRSAPGSVARFFAAYASALLASGTEPMAAIGEEAVRAVSHAFHDNLTLWMDLHLAMHFASAVEGRGTAAQQQHHHQELEPNVAGNSHLPHSVRTSQPAGRSGKTSVLDHVALAYAA